MIPSLLLAASAEATGLLGLFIWLVLLAAIVYILFLIINMIPIPQPIRNIILVVIAVVLFIVVVSRLGVF